MIALRLIQQPDCRTYPCKEECCGWGVDVYPDERQDHAEAAGGDDVVHDLADAERLFLKDVVAHVEPKSEPFADVDLETEAARPREPAPAAVVGDARAGGQVEVESRDACAEPA